MKIERLWLNNNLRNYHYIVACQATKQAVVFDPFDVDMIMDCVNANQWQVSAIINTHEHNDHVAGNAALKAITNAPIYAPDFDVFKDKDVALKVGHEVRVGDALCFTSMFTPGHTNYHYSYSLKYDNTEHLFCGDTIFNAGAGNVYSGNADDLYASFDNILSAFDDNTKIYSGHDLMESNLAFAHSVEPSNQVIIDAMKSIQGQAPELRPTATIGQEKQYNPFMRLRSEEIINSLITNHNYTKHELSNDDDVFCALRELRNKW